MATPKTPFLCSLHSNTSHSTSTSATQSAISILSLDGFSTSQRSCSSKSRKIRHPQVVLHSSLAQEDSMALPKFSTRISLERSWPGSSAAGARSGGRGHLSNPLFISSPSPKKCDRSSAWGFAAAADSKNDTARINTIGNSYVSPFAKSPGVQHSSSAKSLRTCLITAVAPVRASKTYPDYSTDMHTFGLGGVEHENEQNPHHHHHHHQCEFGCPFIADEVDVQPAIVNQQRAHYLDGHPLMGCPQTADASNPYFKSLGSLIDIEYPGTPPTKLSGVASANASESFSPFYRLRSPASPHYGVIFGTGDSSDTFDHLNTNGNIVELRGVNHHTSTPSQSKKAQKVALKDIYSPSSIESMRASYVFTPPPPPPPSANSMTTGTLYDSLFSKK